MERVSATQVIVTGVLAGMILAAAVMAGAQTVTPPAKPPRPALSPPSGSTKTFEQLSPGNRKTARAIFEAQKTTKPLSLDQIAAMKQGGRGWGEIFNDLKKQGLVQDKNLGQAVSRFERHHGTDTSPSAGIRDHVSEGRGNAFADRGFASGGGFGGGHGGGRGR